MTDATIHLAPSRRPVRHGMLWGPLLAALATMAALSLLPAPEPMTSDPTPVEVWHGNAASFGPAG